MTNFADDTQRLVLADVGEGLDELVERITTSSELLSESLLPYGYRQNEDKLVTLPLLAGAGSRVAARAIRRTQGAGCPGVVADNTRSLSAWINAWGSFAHERKRRIDAVRLAKIEVGPMLRQQKPALPLETHFSGLLHSELLTFQHRGVCADEGRLCCP